MPTDQLLAHGVGGAADLPIPASLAIAGAVAALTISFTVLAVAWRTPRYGAQRPGRPAPVWLDATVSSPLFLAIARTVGLIAFGYTAAAAMFGADLVINPFLGIVYVLLWVGIVPASLLLGPFYRAISPVRSIGGLLFRLAGGRAVLSYPERLGYWPAAFGLLAFVWLELVHPDSTSVPTVRLWFAGYLAAMVIGGLLFGDKWYSRADPFEVYSTLIGRLSVWGRHQGRLMLRSPLANVSSTPARPGLTAVVAVLLGSTAYDSLHESGWWALRMQTSTVSPAVWEHVGLIGLCVFAGLLFAGACMATGVGPGVRRVELPNRFAHSIAPIIVGYMVAHYLTLLVEIGQRTVIQMSDPFSTGANILGTGDWSVNYWLSLHPTGLAVTKVLAVVIGHVLGAVAAHDRAISLLPSRHQLTGQLSVLFVMVFFTAGGLLLLFSS
ncbi:hypothetical protein [Nocardioides limicola]|uniref:hypothetical protein n=1 Tax=Nocardioides limicola TaxID=2803368 RepID=UPI001EF0CA1A|nr:hypothetical protein [Nocardioides sp. DJM-14]